MQFNFGIDIDGVITDEGPDDNNIWLIKMNEFFDKKISLKEYSYDLGRAYGIDEQELNAFINSKLKEVYSSVQPAEKASEVLTELYNQGHRLILITARNEKYRPLTENWLQENNIPYHELHHDYNKGPLAKDKNISLFIDDRKENAFEIAAKDIPVILVSKYHNNDFNGNEKITKVNSWDEIKANINSFLSENAPTGKFA